jgi:hypothetical protein
MENRFPPGKYGNLISTVEHERFKVRTWLDFRKHTGHWPILSISFHFLLWLSLIAAIPIFFRISERTGWSSLKFWGAFSIGVALWIAVSQLGSAVIRKLDWKLFRPRLDVGSTRMDR